jgi:hypothetical protein
MNPELWTSLICNWFVECCSARFILTKCQKRYLEYFDQVILNDFNPSSKPALILSKIIPLGISDD